MNKICCVEDDSAILTALQYTLSQEGYEVMTAMTKTQGLELIQQALGHKHLNTTIRYLNIMDDELIEASQKFYMKHSAMYGIDKLL